jgi:hypothetical protein
MRQRHDARPTPCLAYRLMVCAFLSCLGSCQPNGADAPFEIYRDKRNAALTVANSANIFTSVPQLPKVDILHLNTDSANEGVVDFLDVRGCALQSTILKQNSNLGRKAKPSQRLMLELEYLQLAPACISRLREHNNTALAETLEQRRQLQQRQLPALIFNATLGSEEYRAFWQPAPAPGQYPPVEPSVALSALQAINHHVRRWLAGDYRAQQREFELLLSEVAGGNNDAMLEQKKAHHYRELQTAIISLEAQLAPSLPLLYRQWKAQRNRTFARLERAPPIK